MAKYLDLTGLKYFITKRIGKTDISKIGDGTCTGAISALNQSLGNDRFYIFLGDSYMGGYNPDGAAFSPTFMDYIIEYTGIKNYKIASKGGCCFANADNDLQFLIKL